MNKTILLILLIPMHLFAQVFTDTVTFKDTSLQKVGEWETNGLQAWPESENAELIYRFWGHGISVYTDKKSNESYYIAEIDGKQDTVFVQDSRNLKDIRTFFNHRLNYGNHTIKIYGDKYAFTKFVKYVDSNPNPPYYYADSLIIHWDTIAVVNPVPIDSLYTNPVPVDSAYTNPIPLDSPYFVPVKVDSPYYVGLALDSPYYVPNPLDSPYYVPRPIEKPCPNCPDDSNNWWAWVIGGLSIALSLFVILYLTK